MVIPTSSGAKRTDEVLTRALVRQDLQRLVDRSKQVVSQVWYHGAQLVEVVGNAVRRQATEQVERGSQSVRVCTMVPGQLIR